MLLPGAIYSPIFTHGICLFLNPALVVIFSTNVPGRAWAYKFLYPDDRDLPRSWNIGGRYPDYAEVPKKHYLVKLRSAGDYHLSSQFDMFAWTHAAGTMMLIIGHSPSSGMLVASLTLYGYMANIRSMMSQALCHCGNALCRWLVCRYKASWHSTAHIHPIMLAPIPI